MDMYDMMCQDVRTLGHPSSVSVAEVMVFAGPYVTYVTCEALLVRVACLWLLL